MLLKTSYKEKMKKALDLLLVQTKLRMRENVKTPDVNGYGVALPTLAAYERSKGIRTQIYDTGLCSDTYEQIIENIINEAPLVLGISRITTKYIEETFEFINDIRKCGYKGFIFLGGHAATVEYKKCLVKCSGLDCVVLGEGEITISELVLDLINGEQWRNIKGIAFVDNECIKKNETRPLIDDIDKLPFMATDLLEQVQKTQGKKDVTAYLVSSRGCYKNCSFCSIAAYFDMFDGCRMRYRSIQNVFDEMKFLYYNHGIRKFCFWDDTFIIPGKRGIERCRSLAELIKTLPEKISLEIETRVDTISYEIISILKEAGLRNIHLGIESFIDRDLLLYNKGVTVEQNINALAILEELGFSTKVGSELRIATYLISFNPYTSLEDIKTMLYYFKRYKISPKKQITCLYVSNNAPIKQKLISDGIVLGPNNEWDFLDKKVSGIYFRYCSFVENAMIVREKIRTIEKTGLLKEVMFLEEIKKLREDIDNNCIECLDRLVSCNDNCNDDEQFNDILENEYQKIERDFNIFMAKRLTLKVKSILAELGDSTFQENLY